MNKIAKTVVYALSGVVILVSLGYLLAAQNPPALKSDPLQELPKQQQLLEHIANQYGYKPQTIEWKCQPSGGSLKCGSALTLPDTAWNALSQEEKQLIINYAKTQGKSAIVVGQVKDPSTISLDREVWQTAP